MKSFVFSLLYLTILLAYFGQAQNFNPSPVVFVPPVIEFKISQPMVHLDLINYNPSTRGAYAQYPTTFHLYLRHQEWSNWAAFIAIRWDEDFDASNGIQWSIWETNNDQGYYRITTKVFPTPGTYLATFELKITNSNGSQAYSSQKQYQLFVAPLPTLTYADQDGNKLFYLTGYDSLYDRPTFLVEGFDPDNGNTPAINYSLGADLIELARHNGYDVFIMEYANGGVNLAINRSVFLGACTFLHNLLGIREAAVQVVGISMGGTIGRFGLAWAEDNGLDTHPSQHIEHYVNTFISFDSPQQGAHFNMAMQTYLAENGNQSQQEILQSVAAQQMLYNNYYGTLHDDFYNGKLRVLHNAEEPYGYTNGYPKRCINLSVSNGNHNAVYPNLTTNDDLATLSIYPMIDLWDLITFPQPREQVHFRAEPRDLWAGSTFPHDLTTLSTHGTTFVGRGWGVGLWADAYASWRFDVHFNPSYTPTESSLDLDGYTRTANGSLIGGTSWFDGTLEQTASYRHEELTNDSKVQVINWLNAHRTDPYLGTPSNMVLRVNHKQMIIQFVDEAAFEQGFKVERRLENGPYIEVATLPPNTTLFVDSSSSLLPFRTYYYRIRSYHGTKPSVFSREVSGIVQGHLASTTSTATGSNSQRKVASIAGVNHMVYESGNSIWYTQSTGSGWTNERRLSTTGNARGGSIATTLIGTSAYVHAVWEESTSVNPNYWTVKYTYSSDGGATWAEPPRAIGSNHAGMAHPVISSNNERCAVYWKTETGLWGNIEPRLYGAVHPCLVTDSTAHDFSTVSTGLTPEGRHEFLISFVQGPATNSKVYVARIQYAGLYYPLQSTTATNVSGQYSWITDCAHTSLAYANSRIWIAWDAKVKFNTVLEEQPSAGPTMSRNTFVREWNGAQWAPVRTFEHSTHSGRNPSLGIDLRPGMNKVNLVWECGDHIARSTRPITETQWSDITDPGQGYSPNIIQLVSQTNQQMFAVWTSGTTPPFNITLTPFDDATIPQGEIDRVAEVDLGIEGNAISGVTGKLLVRAPKFEIIRGSTRTRIEYQTESGNCPDWMETMNYSVPSNADSVSGSMVLSLSGFRILDPNVPLSTPVITVAISVNNQQYGMRTLTLRDLAGWRTQDTIITLRHRASARNLRGKTISVRQRFYGQDNGTMPLWGEVISSRTAQATEILAQSLAQPFAPSSFALHPNYPNPFNPSTRLSFDVPEDGTVQLTVFDVLGRNVRDLVSEHRGPGTYSVVWDGTSESGLPVSSGVYIARFVATGSNGEALFSETRKLMLMK